MSTCKFYRVRIEGDFNISFPCINEDSIVIDDRVNCGIPPLCSYSRHSLIENEHECGISNQAITFHQNDIFKNDLEHKFAHDTVYVFLQHFYTDNIAHVVGDDLFAVFQSLAIFGLERIKKINVVVTSCVKGKVPELFKSVQIQCVTFSSLKMKFIDNVIIGLSGLSFTSPITRTRTSALENFHDFLVRRFVDSDKNKNNNNNISKKVTVTIIKKDFKHSDHPRGIYNCDEIYKWVIIIYIMIIT